MTETTESPQWTPEERIAILEAQVKYLQATVAKLSKDFDRLLDGLLVALEGPKGI